MSAKRTLADYREIVADVEFSLRSRVPYVELEVLTAQLIGVMAQLIKEIEDHETAMRLVIQYITEEHDPSIGDTLMRRMVDIAHRINEEKGQG